MPEDRIRNLIRTWYDKARYEGDTFSKFVFLWICFNAWLAYRTEEDNDGKMIKCLADKNPKTSDLVAAYDSAWRDKQPIFKSYITKLVGMSKEEPIKDVRGKYQPITIADEHDFANIVRAIYRIRCNLFHGGKDANDSWDGALVTSARCIMETWIHYLIAGWKNR